MKQNSNKTKWRGTKWKKQMNKKEIKKKEIKQKLKEWGLNWTLKKIKDTIIFYQGKEGERGRRRKKCIGATPYIHCRHAPIYHEDLNELFPTRCFFYRRSLHAMPKWPRFLPLISACDTHTNNFSLFFFLFIKIPYCTLPNQISTKKQYEKTENP